MKSNVTAIADQVRRGAGLVRRWLHDARGNVSIIFGLAVIPLMMSMGMAVDYTNQVRVQQRLAGVADAAALAAARADGDEDARIAVAHRYLTANSSVELGNGVTITATTVTYDEETNRVTVDITADVETSLMQIAGIDHTTATARSVTSLEATAGVPVSLALVLDVSGSMDWFGKIIDLRNAATSLLDKLDAADTTHDRLRTGLVTYSTDIREAIPMDWGIGHIRPTVASLDAYGGTSSIQAVQRARNWMTGPREINHHMDMSEQEPLRFVIFMTDGDNNDPKDDGKTSKRCDRIKGDGVEIFSVAFQAPARGRALLADCASSASHYFDASSSEEFLEAFDIILEHIQESMLRIIE
jgi:Flp pilus assembly protein TadG